MHPASGQTYWWLLPRVNIQLFNQVLADFAQHFSLGQNKHVILTEDPRRLAHRSGDRAFQLDYISEFLPPYSPELQPAERLWSILDEPIANRTFENIFELEQLLCVREASGFARIGVAYY